MARRDPIGEAKRAQRQRERLGENPACAFCGERDPDMLELHHVVGGRNDPNFTTVVCRNHHAKLTRAQEDYAVPRREPSTELARIEAALHGLGAHAVAVGEWMQELAKRLPALEAYFDEHAPGWRDRLPPTP